MNIIKVLKKGEISLHNLEYILQQYQHRKLIIGSFSAASNVTGNLWTCTEINFFSSYHQPLFC
jgi:hypothetical protein